MKRLVIHVSARCLVELETSITNLDHVIRIYHSIDMLKELMYDRDMIKMYLDSALIRSRTLIYDLYHIYMPQLMEIFKYLDIRSTYVHILGHTKYGIEDALDECIDYIFSFEEESDKLNKILKYYPEESVDDIMTFLTRYIEFLYNLCTICNAMSFALGDDRHTNVAGHLLRLWKLYDAHLKPLES